MPRAPTTAPAIALTATPVSTSVTTSVRPPCRAVRYPTAAAASPPANAATADVAPPSGASPVTIAATAPTPAPEETQMIPGSASGLGKTPCSPAPATARAAPTSPQRSTRGARMSTSTASWPAVYPASHRIPTFAARIATTSDGAMWTAPAPRLARRWEYPRSRPAPRRRPRLPTGASPNGLVVGQRDAARDERAAVGGGRDLTGSRQVDAVDERVLVAVVVGP